MNHKRSIIHVAPVGRVPSDCLAPVSSKLSEVFDANVEILDTRSVMEDAFDMSRNQYNSGTILESLLVDAPDDGGKILGLTDVDLFVPIFTFVFGEAQLNGRVALASSFRLRNDLYGLPEDFDLLRERLIKEAVHETGHAFGLVHCLNPRCVMHVSTVVEEVDLKRADLCDVCHHRLAQGRGNGQS